MEDRQRKIMKQSATTSCSEESFLLASAVEDEIVVSQILLDLRNLMSLSSYLGKLNWTCRRRRSCLDAPPPSPGAPPPQPPPPSVQRTDDGIEETRPHIKAAEEVEEKKDDAGRTTTSPDTPLSFSPSESDEKSKHSSKKTSRKRSKEEYMGTIEELTERKELLTGEIENVKKYYKKLKAYNSKLKAKKKEVLNSCPRKEEPQMERINFGMELTQHYRIDMVHHQQPFIADPTVHNFPFTYRPTKTQFLSSSNGLGSVNQVGPLGFDLNIPAEEAFGEEPSQPLDLNMALADQRARCAEARRRRRGILKIKAMRNASGIKLPTSK